MKAILWFLTLLFVSSISFSQTAKPKINGWHLLDPETDGYMGISLNKAYELLKGRKNSTVIVAVIDSGIDTLQEDLRQVLWRNQKEISGNGKDDDGNGYADDVYGWNFCGSSNGENLVRNSHEIARVYHNWKGEFEKKKEKSIPADKKFLYQQWMKAEAIINRDYDASVKSQSNVTNFLSALEQSSKILMEELAVSEFTAVAIQPFLTSKDKRLSMSAKLWADVFPKGSETTKSTQVLDEVKAYANDIQNKINRKLIPPEDLRGSLVKDNYLDINDRFYGNNNLKTGSGDHGTLVSGTIAAVRNNGIGIDGIADHVQIMAIRAVPGGDEHDKDVALAICYAVNNGAKIINMSFGKPVSPFKQFVDDAVRYAASKGVLLVHGAGNDGKDISDEIFYPNPVLLDLTKATNYLTVGASGDISTGGYAASFSNYSSKTVDLFAPGMHIFATGADNRYVEADGTSLACPVVSGVAALLASYFPNLTPEQIIHILITSGRSIKEDVVQPGTEDQKIPFSSLSSSGKVVNAYEAVKLALSMEKEKKAF